MLLRATDLQLVVNHPFTCTIGFGVVRVSPDFLEIYLLLDNISNDNYVKKNKETAHAPSNFNIILQCILSGRPGTNRECLQCNFTTWTNQKLLVLVKYVTSWFT